MSNSLVIIFNNLTNTTFSQYPPGCGGLIDTHLDHVAQQPATTLPPGDTQQFNVALEHSDLVSGSGVSIAWSWTDDVNFFGIQIQAYFQFLTAGAAPTWNPLYGPYVADPPTQSGPAPAPTPAPMSQFTFPTSLGYSILATPTSGHQSLSVTVAISNLPISKPVTKHS